MKTHEMTTLAEMQSTRTFYSNMQNHEIVGEMFDEPTAGHIYETRDRDGEIMYTYLELPDANGFYDCDLIGTFATRALAEYAIWEFNMIEAGYQL